MGYITNLITDVEETHPNFGKLVAVCQIAVKARKFTLIVSPSGCGKSRAIDYIAMHTPNSWKPLQLSVNSLQNVAETLTNFRSGIFFDDLANINTDYARKATINTISALCYTHRIENPMADKPFAIEDFYGSALLGVQPRILKDLILTDEWDSSVKDKALRYYHLYRPIVPNLNYPVAQVENGINFDAVEFEPDLQSEKWRKLYLLGLTQWSRARAKEHMTDLLKAVASLENRNHVIEDDFDILYELLKPMAVEEIAVNKDELEGDRIFDNNLVALLAEYYTYGGTFTLANVSIDFGMKKGALGMARTYQIMASQNGNWQQIEKSNPKKKTPTAFKPSKLLQSLLEEYDLHIKGNKNELQN